MQQRKFLRPALVIVALCRLSIAATGCHWLATGRGLWAGIAVAALVITALPFALLQDAKLRDATSAVLSVLLAAHIVLGMLGLLYDTSVWYDKGMHLLGSGALAGLGMLAVHRYGDRHSIAFPFTFKLMIVLAGTLSAGALWELFEYGVDRTGLFAAQRGLEDTMLDLLANTMGASAAMVLYAVSLAVSRRVTPGNRRGRRSPKRAPA